MQVDFEMVRCLVTKRRMPSLGVVIGDVVADFERSLGQSMEDPTVEQLGFEATPKQFSVGVIVAVAASAHTLHGAMPGQ